MAVVKSNPTANLLQLKMRSVKYILKNCTLFLCYTPTVGKIHVFWCHCKLPARQSKHLTQV